MDFRPFDKIGRWSRDIVITEKIDGTNSAVVVVDGLEGVAAPGVVAKVRNLDVFAQSRTRFITPADDNFGFARWVAENADELCDRTGGLGVGQHFGEWWGNGIQRKYGQDRKRFSLFNVGRWAANDTCVLDGQERVPECCDVVPTLYRGPNSESEVLRALSRLELSGSVAAPGFMNPEGIVIFHTSNGALFKKTIEKDEVPKALAAKMLASERAAERALS